MSLSALRGSATSDARAHHHPAGPPRRTTSRLRRCCTWSGARDGLAFWILGLANNTGYVVMLACANEISNGAVGTVYLAAVLPALLVKASAPYWFSRAPYSARAAAVAALATAAFLCVGLGTSRTPQLIGVCLASLQSGLGEASTLALAGAYPGHRSLLTCWSSGTGFAGPFGYLWVAGLHTLGGLTLRATVLLANVIPVAWCVAQFWMLRSPSDAAAAAAAAAGALSPSDALAAADEAIAAEAAAAADVVSTPGGGLRLEHGTGRASSGAGGGAGGAGGAFARSRSRSAEAETAVTHPRPPSGRRVVAPDGVPATDAEKGALSPALCTDPPAPRGFLATTRHVLGLWRYTIPLLVVYFSEYAAQSGAWSAIGIPSPLDKKARDRFYKFGNLLYQVGVFISRSSGAVYQASMVGLWVMPAAQAGLLAFFVSVAATRWWNNWALLVPCFICGLLGGGVYVNAFTLLARNEPPTTRELSLGAASVADSIGIALADIFGVLLQGCLFRVNGVPGAAFKCGAPAPPPGVGAGVAGGGH
jgi:battenin